MDMQVDLQAKVAIVTGAGQGIGAAIARALAQAGARVGVNDINPDRAERVAADIRTAGGEALGVGADVANKFQCVTLIEAVRAEWGRLDILVNNAAVSPVRSIIKMDEWDFQRCLDVNLKGTFFMSQLCGRVMKDENQERGGGAIVNIGDLVGVRSASEGRAAYAASKAAVVGFARECAREYAAYGIRVNTVLPGIIEGASTKREIPLGRIGRGDEVAQMVLFLCSEASSYVTGATFTVDGGMGC